MNRTTLTPVAVSVAFCAVLAAFVLGATLLRPAPVPAPAIGVAQAAPNAPQKSLAISGTATLNVVPDRLDVAIELGVDRAASSRAAAAEIERRRLRLVGGLEKAGIDRASTERSQLSIQPVWAPSPTRIVGYSASLSITVSLRDFDKVTRVLDAAAAAGARRLTSGFRSTQMPELKARVRSMALDAAKAKANQIAESLEIDHLEVVAVSESPTGAGWGYGYRSPWQVGVANAVAVANPAAVTGGSFAPEIQPLTLTVSVSYAIGD